MACNTTVAPALFTMLVPEVLSQSGLAEKSGVAEKTCHEKQK
jgi:hypothetical protein